MLDTLALNFFNLDVLAAAWPLLLRGLLATIGLAALVVPLGAAAGLALAITMVGARPMWRWLLFAWVDFFRAFPPLVLLIYVYYGAPMVGLDIGALTSIAVAFTLNTSSYFAEIFRAGLRSVPEGQWDAARALGLPWWLTMRLVILPQGWRVVLPDLLSNVITVTQLTALASVVAIPELLNAAMRAQSVTYNASPLIAAAILYLALLWPAVRATSVLEARARRRGRRRR
jgi:polar amino acid transport system permease protein